MFWVQSIDVQHISICNFRSNRYLLIRDNRISLYVCVFCCNRTGSDHLLIDRGSNICCFSNNVTDSIF